MSSRVRALSVAYVQPDQAANPPSRNAVDHAIKLSLFDAMFIPFAPVQPLFFYDGDGLPPFPSLSSSLRSSLAATLAIFTPLAGKLTASSSDEVFIDCSPGAVSPGVRFVEAEYAGDMRRLAVDAEHDVEAFRQLVPEFPVGKLPAPVLAVKVTRPTYDAGGGTGVVAVGVAIHHAVADGKALWQFLRAWAAVSRSGSLAGSGLRPPTFDRAVVNRHPKAEEVARKYVSILAPALPTVSADQTSFNVSRPVRSSMIAMSVLISVGIAIRITSASSQVNAFPEADIKQQRRRTYLLRADQIRSLKRRISLRSSRGAKDEPAVVEPPSTFVAVASLVWTSIVRAKNCSNHAGVDVFLMLAADCRARLRPPLDDTFFGNCVKSCYARATVGELRGSGDDHDGALARAAAAVRDAVRVYLEDPLANAERWLELRQSLPPERIAQIGSSHRFMAYETDFGWGAPSRVELVWAILKELVALLGAPDGAVQVSVALDPGAPGRFRSQLLVAAAGLNMTLIVRVMYVCMVCCPMCIVIVVFRN
ncbi:hypothetical protein EJB05_46325, partial [Eragrostis curvula]